MNALEVLELLENTSSSSEKQKILSANKGNTELAFLLDAALNFKRKFFVNKFDITTNPNRQNVSITAFADLLSALQTRSVTGNSAKSWVESLLGDCIPLQQKWYARVLRKNLRAGFGLTEANKAGFNIPDFEVMLAKDGKECKKLKEIISAGVYASPKFNGYRCLAVSDSGNVTLYSRNGLVYENFPSIVSELNKIGGNFVLDGEIMSDDFNAMQQTAMSSKSNKSVGDVYYAVFGWIPVDEWDVQEFKAPTKQRLDSLQVWYESIDKKVDLNLIRLVEHKLIYKLEDALQYEKDCLAAKYEGAMLLPNIPYYLGKKSNKLLKLKTFESMDCQVLKVYEGTGKYIGMMGGITVIQENGKECDIGSGFSDEDRKFMWDNQEQWYNKVVEVQYQELTPYGIMQFPTFTRWRSDKDETD